MWKEKTKCFSQSRSWKCCVFLRRSRNNCGFFCTCTIFHSFSSLLFWFLFFCLCFVLFRNSFHVCFLSLFRFVHTVSNVKSKSTLECYHGREFIIRKQRCQSCEVNKSIIWLDLWVSGKSVAFERVHKKWSKNRHNNWCNFFSFSLSCIALVFFFLSKKWISKLFPTRFNSCAFFRRVHRKQWVNNTWQLLSGFFVMNWISEMPWKRQTTMKKKKVGLWKQANAILSVASATLAVWYNQNLPSSSSTSLFSIWLMVWHWFGLVHGRRHTLFEQCKS